MARNEDDKFPLQNAAQGFENQHFHQLMHHRWDT